MPTLAKNHHTPMANIRFPRGQTQAMRLVLDYVKTGHYYYRTGWITKDKISGFVEEMHQKVGIGMTRHQRDYARRNGRATGHLVLVKPYGEFSDGFKKVFFCLLWTEGVGAFDVYQRYHDTREPHQRIHFETVKESQNGTWETSKIYRLAHLEHRQYVAKNRLGEVLIDSDGGERLTSGGRHLTWLMTTEVVHDTKNRAKEFVGRFLSSYKKLTPAAADSIIKWSNYLQQRPGFHGINQQRYQLRCIIWAALRVAAMRRDVRLEVVQPLVDSIYTALDISPPINPNKHRAWSNDTLAGWLDSVDGKIRF